MVLIKATEWCAHAKRGMQSVLPAETRHNYKKNVKSIQDNFCTYPSKDVVFLDNR